MKFVVYVILLAAMSLSACQQNPGSQVEADLSAIRSQLEDIEAVLSSGLPITTINQKYLEFFVDELVLLPPGRKAVHGREAALAFYNDTFGMITALSMVYQAPEIIVEGNLATRRYVGNSKFQIDTESEPGSASGRYVDILQKQSDGAWRIVWHTWTRLNR